MSLTPHIVQGSNVRVFPLIIGNWRKVIKFFYDDNVEKQKENLFSISIVFQVNKNFSYPWLVSYVF